MRKLFDNLLLLGRWKYSEVTLALCNFLVWLPGRKFISHSFEQILG